MSNNELVRILREVLNNRFQEKPVYQKALLGDGNGNVSVPGRSDYVYVRLERSQGKFARPSVVFNSTVQGPEDTPVVIGIKPHQPDLVQVIGVDYQVFDGYKGGTGWNGFTEVAKHGTRHEWSPTDGAGSDVITVYPRAMYALRTMANSGGGLTINIGGLTYFQGGEIKHYYGELAYDMSSHVPVSGQTAVLVYLDPTTKVIGVSLGKNSPVAPGVIAPYPKVPAGVIPSAILYLSAGMTNITEGAIIDARQILDGGDDIANNFNANREPLANDDLRSGYQPGSIWTTTSGQFFICTSNTMLEAVWLEVWTESSLAYVPSDASMVLKFDGAGSAVEGFAIDIKGHKGQGVNINGGIGGVPGKYDGAGRFGYGSSGGSGHNLISNPQFTWLNPANPFELSFTTQKWRTLSSLGVFSGTGADAMSNFSMQLLGVPNSLSHIETDTMQLSTNTSYVVSCYVKSSYYTVDGVDSVEIIVTYPDDEPGNYYLYTPSGHNRYSTLSTALSFTRLTTAFTPLYENVRIRIRLIATGTGTGIFLGSKEIGAGVYIDQVMLSEGTIATLPDYADGETAGWQWQGQAWLSPSGNQPSELQLDEYIVDKNKGCFSFWYRPLFNQGSVAENKVFFDFNSFNALYYDDTNETLNFTHQSSFVPHMISEPVRLISGTWHHIVFNYAEDNDADSYGTCNLYFDGNLVANETNFRTNAQPFLDIDTYVSVGYPSRFSGGGGLLEGDLDDLAIFTGKNLTAGEVKAIYRSNQPIPTSSNYSYDFGSTDSEIATSATVERLDDVQDVSVGAPSNLDVVYRNGASDEWWAGSLSTVHGSQDEHKVFMPPTGSSGNPIWRLLEKGDLPILNFADIEGQLNFSDLTGTLLLDELGNVNTNAPREPFEGAYLRYVGTDWVPASGSTEGGGGGATNLYALDDVDVQGVVTGEFLAYNGTQWVNTPPSPDSLSALTDTNLQSLVTGEVLSYNGTEWVNSPVVTSLDGLSDVTIATGVSSGYELLWRGTGGDWGNFELNETSWASLFNDDSFFHYGALTRVNSLEMSLFALYDTTIVTGSPNNQMANHYGSHRPLDVIGSGSTVAGGYSGDGFSLPYISGTSSYLEFVDDTTLLGTGVSWSLAMWFKPDSSSMNGDGVLYTESIATVPDGGINIVINDSTTTITVYAVQHSTGKTVSLQDNGYFGDSWQYIVVSYHAGSGLLQLYRNMGYVDGTYLDFTPSHNLGSGNNAKIGGLNQSSSDWQFSGVLDNIFIYQRPLTAGEVIYLKFSIDDGDFPPTNANWALRDITLDSLSDVYKSPPLIMLEYGEHELVYKGSSWVSMPRITNLDDLYDVTATGGFAAGKYLGLLDGQGNWGVFDKPIDTLAELSDTELPSPSNNDYLRYMSGSWGAYPLTYPTSLSELTDVSSGLAPTAGQAFIYNGTAWDAANITGNAEVLSDLTDVDTSGVANDYVLIYNSANARWEPGSIDTLVTGSGDSGGGGVGGTLYLYHNYI